MKTLSQEDKATLHKIKMSIQARRIQRNFRLYLEKQQELERIRQIEI